MLLRSGSQDPEKLSGQRNHCRLTVVNVKHFFFFYLNMFFNHTGVNFSNEFHISVMKIKLDGCIFNFGGIQGMEGSIGATKISMKFMICA